MKIEIGKKYQIITSAGLPYGRKFRRVLAVDVAGIYPVVVELLGGEIERFTYEGRALVFVGDYDEECEEVILIEVKEGGKMNEQRKHFIEWATDNRKLGAMEELFAWEAWKASREAALRD